MPIFLIYLFVVLFFVSLPDLNGQAEFTYNNSTLSLHQFEKLCPVFTDSSSVKAKAKPVSTGFYGTDICLYIQIIIQL